MISNSSYGTDDQHPPHWLIWPRQAAFERFSGCKSEPNPALIPLSVTMNSGPSSSDEITQTSKYTPTKTVEL
jgi:hypothetical protein